MAVVVTSPPICGLGFSVGRTGGAPKIPDPARCGQGHTPPPPRGRPPRGGSPTGGPDSVAHAEAGHERGRVPVAPGRARRHRLPDLGEVVGGEVQLRRGQRLGQPLAGAVAGLIDRLEASSADFRRLWAEHEVAVRRADRKTILHPRVGRMLMDCETLVTPDQGQQLLVLTPADAETRERLELLRVLGIEEFPTARRARPHGEKRSVSAPTSRWRKSFTQGR
ncbi:hypothetical protein AB0C21_26960 [Spirillospora sp. NPDC049024]